MSQNPTNEIHPDRRMSTTGLQPYAPPSSSKLETFDQKLWRKFSEEPLVPIGCGVTLYFLVSGIRSFYNGNAKRSQSMMRARVLSQGLTIGAFVGYGVYNAYQQKYNGKGGDEKGVNDRDARILDPDRK